MIFRGVCVSRSSVFCVFFCRSLFVSLYIFVPGHWVACLSIYGLWLPLWYLQSLLSFPDHLYSFYLCGMSVYIDDVSIFILYTIFTSLHDLFCTYCISKQVILCCLNNTISYRFVCLFTRSIFWFHFYQIWQRSVFVIIWHKWLFKKNEE